jgi:anti-sigma factor RsiW
MFNCEDVLAELSNFIDEEVPDTLRREIEMHLHECRTCHALYDSTRKTLRIVTESASFELPDAVSTRVTESIKAKIRAMASKPTSDKSHL